MKNREKIVRSMGLGVIILSSVPTYSQDGCINSGDGYFSIFWPTEEPQVISDCISFNAEVLIEDIMVGYNYRFTISGNGYMTIRDGYGWPGTILAQGHDTLELMPMSSVLQVTYNVNSACDIADACELATYGMISPFPTSQLDCNAPLVETYCHQMAGGRIWRYTADEAIRLRFNMGTVQLYGNSPNLSIHDGIDASGPILYQMSVNGQTCNLGPEGSAVDNDYDCYENIDVVAVSGSMFMYYRSDPSNCPGATFGFDPLVWEVTCGNAISGKVFLDTNLDCDQTPGEPGVPQILLEVQPGPIYSTTNATGEFNLMLPDGDYTISQLNPYVTDHCNSGAIQFTVNDSMEAQFLLFPDTALLPLDLQVMMSAGPARVGFMHMRSINVKNLSAAVSENVQLKMVDDAVLLFEEAIPVPASVQGDTILWDLAPFTPFEERTFIVHYMVPADIDLLGASVSTTASLVNVDDFDLENNSFTLDRTITGAYDPNDKIATTTYGSDQHWIIEEDEWIDYTIRFQNTGTDTAFTVVITDTLNAVLDPASIQIGAASHPFTWELKGQGILEFTFTNILLPDSNVNESASHGFVGFRIRPHLPLMPGEQIENIANIYFDFNPPVITEPSILVATLSTGIASYAITNVIILFPQPSSGVFEVSGLDPATVLNELRIFSIDGRMILNKRVEADQRIFDIGWLQNGQYIAEFNSDQGPIARKPLLIIR